MKHAVIASLALALMVSLGAEEQAPTGPLDTLDPDRYTKRTELWERVGGDLLHGFVNMYNLDILHAPEDEGYPFKGWFFGWATEICNPGYEGCDAIYAARAPELTGPWEVYMGEEDGEPQWDATMTPEKWVPVLDGGGRFFDNWHNGDPSVIEVGGLYYMAYSATGHNKDGIPYGHPDDTDSDISCVMGAYSEDGIHWTRTDWPILIYEDNIGQEPMNPGSYFHPEGLYHRPSLKYEDGIYKIWFDGFDGSNFTMLYAENHGDFLDPEQWKVVRGLDNPCIVNYPNPSVVRIGDVYFAYGDPGGFEGEGWASRQTAEAVSLDGKDWVLLGYIESDPDVQANHVPEALVWEEDGTTWMYLTYGAQTPGDYRYEAIRMMRRPITDADLERYAAIAAEADGPVPFTPREEPAADGEE